MKVKTLTFDNIIQALSTPGGTQLATGTLVRRLKPANNRPHQLIKVNGVTKERSKKVKEIFRKIQAQVSRERRWDAANKAYQPGKGVFNAPPKSKLRLGEAPPPKPATIYKGPGTSYKDLADKGVPGYSPFKEPAPKPPKVPKTSRALKPASYYAELEAAGVHPKPGVTWLQVEQERRYKASRSYRDSAEFKAETAQREQEDKAAIERSRELAKTYSTWEEFQTILLEHKGAATLQEARQLYTDIGYAHSIFHTFFLL